MVPDASSERNRRAEKRTQEKIIACLWLPFSLLFHLWIYLTPTEEERGAPTTSAGRPQSRPAVTRSFLLAALLVTSVLGFALFVLMTMPPLASRVLLILTFGFSLWQFMRPKI